MKHTDQPTTPRRIKKAYIAAGGAAVLALLLGACDKYTEPFKDSPRSGVVNNQPADIIRMPDGFSAAATKCDHGNRIYTLYHGDSKYGAIWGVPADPTCRGK